MKACEKCGHQPEQKPTSWVIEGEWSGYTSSQRRVVHRVYERSKDFADKVQKLGSIIYTDGTALYLSVKPHRGRKVEREIHGYDSLIRDCIAKGVNRVALLKETATERAARLELEAAEKTTPQVPA